MRYTVLIIVAFLFISCHKLEDWYSERNENMDIRMRVKKSNSFWLRANGVDTAKIFVIFPISSKTDESELNLPEIEFEVSFGHFLNNNEKIFKSSEPEDDCSVSDSICISATLSPTTNADVRYVKVIVPELVEHTLRVDYIASVPSGIKVFPDKFSVYNDKKDEILISAKVYSELGIASQRTEVNFKVADTLYSDNIKYFLDLKKTDAEGISTVRFSPGNLNGFLGTLPIVAYVYGENGILISDTTFVELIQVE